MVATCYADVLLLGVGYAKYNVVAKKLARRVEALGAAALLPRGLGDDQHPSGYEAALDPWLRALWPALRAQHPLPPGTPEVPLLLVPRALHHRHDRVAGVQACSWAAVQHRSLIAWPVPCSRRLTTPGRS